MPRADEHEDPRAAGADDLAADANGGSRDSLDDGAHPAILYARRMAVVELRDREVIAEFCRRRPAVHAYALGDLDEVLAFYARAYPGTWFEPRMLETRRYVGIRDEHGLVCVAGVHVWSPEWRVAALGNVATVPESRGRGLAKAACAQLCRVLLDDGIDTISLNVRADNLAAIAAYEKLGFAHAADYVEVPLSRA